MSPEHGTPAPGAPSAGTPAPGTQATGVPADRSPVIDVHSHYIPPAYWDAVTARVAADATFASLAARNNLVPQDPAGPMRTVEARIGGMDEAGVDVSVLSLPPPGASVRPGDAELSRRMNDDLVAAAEKFPDRLRVLATVPLPDVAAATAELARILPHPLVRGVAVTSDLSAWKLDDPALDPVFARVAGAGMPLFVHPALEPVPDAYADFALTASISAVVSSTLGVLRMIYHGTFDRLPELTVIMPHLGGVIPYLLARLDDLGGRQRAREPVAYYLTHHLVLDTCSYHPPAFRCALETVGARRLALGTDYPFRGTLARAVADVRQHRLPAAEEAAVLGGNVARWFG